MRISADGAERVFGRYVERHAANDLDGVMALFAEEAVVEDPVGLPAHRGIDAVRAFYAETHRRNGTMRIERVGPVLAGGAEFVAHVRAELDREGAPPAMDVIYVIELESEGRIRSLRAWY